MAERQVSQRDSPPTRGEFAESEDDQEARQYDYSQRSTAGIGSAARPTENEQSSLALGNEVKDLLKVVVQQQAVQNKKLDILENRMEKTSTKVDQVAIRIRRDDKKVFKKKGIEFQYRHNAAVIENYEEINMAVATRNYDAIPQIVDRGMSFINKRQRTLCFADEKGWVFIEVYEADDIAIDSDDDKKIKKAEKRSKELVDQRFKSKKVKYNNRNNNSSFSSNDGYSGNRSSDQGFRQFSSNRTGSGWNQGSLYPIEDRMVEVNAITVVAFVIMLMNVRIDVIVLSLGRPNVSLLLLV